MKYKAVLQSSGIVDEPFLKMGAPFVGNAILVDGYASMRLAD